MITKLTWTFVRICNPAPSAPPSIGRQFPQQWQSLPQQLCPAASFGGDGFQLHIRSQDPTPLRQFRGKKIDQEWDGGAAAAADQQQHNQSADQTYQSLHQVPWLVTTRREPFDDNRRLEGEELYQQLQGTVSSAESSEVDADPKAKGQHRKFIYGQLGNEAKSFGCNRKAGQWGVRRNTNDGELEKSKIYLSMNADGEKDKDGHAWKIL